MMTTPRVLVGCPTSDHKAYCLDRYAQAIQRLTYPAYDLLLVDNSETDGYAERITHLGIPVLKDTYAERARDRIVHSRNLLRQHAIDHGYEYLLSLEQDVIPPPDVIQRLLHHKKPITTGVYFKEYHLIKNNKVVGKEIKPLLYKAPGPDKNDLAQLTTRDIERTPVFPVDACGLGCILIHRSVLEQVTFRYNKRYPPFDDIWFCRDARTLRIPIYVDPTLKCLHLTTTMSWDTITK